MTMSNLPTNGTPAEKWARVMTNRELAYVLGHLNDRRGGTGHDRARARYTPVEKHAALTEAARRLDWPDAYDKHSVVGDCEACGHHVYHNTAYHRNDAGLFHAGGCPEETTT